MKRMKKIAALLLAMIMVLAMGMTAFAEEGDEADTSCSVSIEKVPTGHTYKVYQIFTGKLDSTGKILSDIEYGENYEGNSDYDSAYHEAQSITDANEFAADIELVGDPVAILTGETKSETLPGSGYYMVVDSTANTEGDQVSKYIVSVGGNITITPKVSNVPGFEKTVDDGAKATVDYAAGDSIPFTLTATMPEDVAEYDTYQLTFKDTLSDNLTFVESTVKVSYQIGESVTEYAAEAYLLDVDGQNVTITMDDIGDDARVSRAKVIVTYNATLSDTVDSGEVASNEAKLEYGNNGDTQGVGTTTTEEVKVYTFKLAISKVNEDGAALGGAGFTLYDEDGEVVATIDAEAGKTEFEFKGLKEGNYTLEETTVPDGYNKMENMTIDVGATVNGENVVANPADDWTVNGFVYSTDITNYAGVQLPSTGGIGTTIFYVVGGILVLGAGVLLITKKRMSARN